MPRNVEIKARVRDVADLRARVEQLSDDTPGEILNQEDTFYGTSHGRLKLRVLAPDRCELIYYERPDEFSAKTSTYEIVRSGNPEAFARILKSVLPLRGIVTKRRRLYHIGQTRVHLDTVDGLGEFIELEVILATHQSADEGQRIAQGLMAQLQIPREDLVANAYMDLLERKTG